MANDPLDFVKIEETIASHMLSSFEAMLGDTVSKIEHMCTAGDFSGAYAIINSLDLTGLIESKRIEFEKQAISAALFGAAEVVPLHETEMVKTLQVPQEVFNAVDQLVVMMETHVAEMIRDDLRTTVRNFELEAKDELHAVSKADLEALYVRWNEARNQMASPLRWYLDRREQAELNVDPFLTAVGLSEGVGLHVLQDAMFAYGHLPWKDAFGHGVAILQVPESIQQGTPLLDTSVDALQRKAFLYSHAGIGEPPKNAGEVEVGIKFSPTSLQLDGYDDLHADPWALQSVMKDAAPYKEVDKLNPKDIADENDPDIEDTTGWSQAVANPPMKSPKKGKIVGYTKYDESESRDASGKWTASGSEIADAKSALDKLHLSNHGFDIPIVEGKDRHAAVQLYHGTSDAFMKDIKANGLVTGHGGGADELAASNPNMKTLLKRTPSVFVSAVQGAAMNYAYVAAEHHGGKPVVFKVDVPVSQLKNFLPDEYGQATYAVRSEHNIPKEWIAGVVKPAKHKKEETKTVYFIAFVDDGKDVRKEEARDADGRWAVGGEQWETLHRGVGPVSPSNGNFYTADKEFARQFTQSGQDKEIKTRYVRSADIHESTETYAGDEAGVDAAIEHAKKVGKKAIRINEGAGQPNSVFVFDKTALKIAKPVAKDDFGEDDLDTGGKQQPDQSSFPSMASLLAKRRKLLNAIKAELGSKNLYVHRKLVNTSALVEWAKDNGFTSTLDPSDMHVTVVYSKTPVVGATPDLNPLTVEGGGREIEQFGKATVLHFTSPELADRNFMLSLLGASSDFDQYRSHVTISYDGAPDNVGSLTPYMGPLEFGPEIHAPLNNDWFDDKVESVIKADAVMSALAAKMNEATIGNGKKLFDIGANLTTSRLIAFGFLSQAAKVGHTTYQVNEILDSKTCPVCVFMHGKTFTVPLEYGKVLQTLGTSDPKQLKSLAPWPDQSKKGLIHLYGLTTPEMQTLGYGSPPYHPHCRGYLSVAGTVTESIPTGTLSDQVQAIIDGLQPHNPDLVPMGQAIQESSDGADEAEEEHDEQEISDTEADTEADTAVAEAADAALNGPTLEEKQLINHVTDAINPIDGSPEEAFLAPSDFIEMAGNGDDDAQKAFYDSAKTVVDPKSALNIKALLDDGEYEAAANELAAQGVDVSDFYHPSDILSESSHIPEEASVPNDDFGGLKPDDDENSKLSHEKEVFYQNATVTGSPEDKELTSVIDPLPPQDFANASFHRAMGNWKDLDQILSDNGIDVNFLPTPDPTTDPTTQNSTDVPDPQQ